VLKKSDFYLGRLFENPTSRVVGCYEGNQLNGYMIFDFKEFKGALAEQYVLQQLTFEKEITPFYWSAEKGQAELDFVFQSGRHIVPLEVKAEENLQAKSLKSYCSKFQPKYAIRSSMSNFRQEDWMVNFPLYAINVLPDWIQTQEHKEGPALPV
jgi:predicted AAA+ superfamily ATPase